MLDLILAIAHHLLVFALFGILCMELIAVRWGMRQTAVAEIVVIDLYYGILAALILVVGFSRVFFAAKGWEYYSHNSFFWAKIAVFVTIAILSVPPTLAYMRWKRSGEPPNNVEVSGARRLLYAELVLFALLPIFAAAMARGFGEF